MKFNVQVKSKKFAIEITKNKARIKSC
ncbi:MAG: hypothetical protein CVV39_05025 [Planctomycetes bacterium HGW-Planctomycetes-1]|nr:MAG: hypothetical protein CVV39_05025 [Planctomycetes bacterium HGW-Planctomycetes-1]